jgi:hypothetical protein
MGILKNVLKSATTENAPLSKACCFRLMASKYVEKANIICPSIPLALGGSLGQKIVTEVDYYPQVGLLVIDYPHFPPIKRPPDGHGLAPVWGP